MTAACFTDPQSTRPVVEAHNLTKTFHSTQPPAQVLKGIDLTVYDGEFVAVMGASGSGKSTLLYAISGMDRPTRGWVRLAGQDVTGLKDAQMARLRLTTLGFVFQQPYFLANLTIRDNVLLPAFKAARSGRKTKELVGKRVDALLERFQIEHISSNGVTEVSGGQIQRAAICRALACEPRILFADEPTGALNSAMSQEVMDALVQAHRGGTTVVMVTHDPACAARADRVVYLRDGYLVDTWTAAGGPVQDKGQQDGGQRDGGQRDTGQQNTGKQNNGQRVSELSEWLHDLGF